MSILETFDLPSRAADAARRCRKSCGFMDLLRREGVMSLLSWKKENQESKEQKGKKKQRVTRQQTQETRGTKKKNTEDRTAEKESTFLYNLVCAAGRWRERDVRF